MSFSWDMAERMLIPSSSHSDAVFVVLISHVNPVLVTRPLWWYLQALVNPVSSVPSVTKTEMSDFT